jgi:hypothetical protein
MGNGNPPAREETERLQALLATVSSRVSAQEQIVWVIFTVFAAAHAILLDALFSSGRFTLMGRGALVISLTGLVFAYGWLHAQVRAVGHLIRLENVGRRIEEELAMDREFRTLTDEIDSDEHHASANLRLWPLPYELDLLRNTPPVRSVLVWLPSGACVLWIFIVAWKIRQWAF